MTIVSLITIHPNPGVKWDDLQKLLKKGGVTSPVSMALRT